MRQEIRLFIGDREIEFSQPPAIYYNYAVKDLTLPTAVKSSFSRSIDVEGTPNNNDVFGHYWDLERYQSEGSYNAMQKVDFKLFVNGNLYEKGYCRLMEVSKTGRTIKYKINLNGGLGSFFAGLAWQDGEGEQKKTLADLVFRPYGDPEQSRINLDFTINKEAVNQAWNQLAGITDEYKKWDVINFAVCSEGVPEDFEPSKVLMNNIQSISDMTHQDGDYAGVLGTGISGTGYALGESRVEMTSDMTLDLRSYLLRPVVSVKQIFNAIQMPENSNGWEVKLDSHFFNSLNPYYNDAYITLSKLRDLGIERVNSINPSVTLTKTSYNWRTINYTNTLEKQTNFDLTCNLSLTGLGSTNATQLWQSSNVTTDARYNNSSSYVKEFEYNESCYLQVVGYDGNGLEVARSKTIHCISDNYYDDNLPDTVYGHFEKVNGQWIFCDRFGNPADLHFSFRSSANFSSLKMYISVPGHYKYRLTKGWIDKKDTVNFKDESPNSFYTQPSDYWTGLHTLPETEAHNRVQGEYAFVNLNLNVVMDNFDGFFSGTKISADKLLETPYSVCDWLLGYCKLFGLYFYVEPTEESDFPSIYPKGVVHIVDRDTFYTDEYVNLQEEIDRSREIKINPTLASTKWYKFSYDEGDGYNEKVYRDNYGFEYGRAIVNTNLEHNNDTTSLLDGTPFRNGVMVQEKQAYFMQPDIAVPVYVYDGFKYQLFKKNGDEYEGKEYSYPYKKFYTEDLNSQGLKYYDVMPKLQIHSDGNNPEDGSGILLFYSDFVNTQFAYNLTDDVPEMGLVNDGTPCWLFSPTATEDGAGNTIAIQRYSLPLFTRDIYQNGVTGKIIHSWNFGHPMVTYVPYTFSTDFDCIYDKCWREYMRDLYDVNSKSVTCYIKLKEKPNIGLMRKWYWFDNALWYINSIKDWDIGSYEPTKVEFIKVQDVDNYSLQQITREGRIQVVLASYSITNSAQTLNGQVICQNPSESWAFGQYITWTDGYHSGSTNPPSPAYGTGDTQFSISVPANTSAVSRTYKIQIRNADNQWMPDTYFTQQGNVTPFIDFLPSSKDKTVQANAQTVVLSFDYYNINPSTITVTSNSTVWCSVQSVDTQAKTVTLSVGASGMGQLRTALLTISGSGVGGSVSKSTTLKQEGAALDVYPMAINLDYFSTSGGAINIITSTEWTATIEDGNGE